MDGRAVVGRLCVAMVLCGGGRSSPLCVLTVHSSACICQATAATRSPWHGRQWRAHIGLARASSLRDSTKLLVRREKHCV
eukprot:6081793-Prymnesium_polylepis.1